MAEANDGMDLAMDQAGPVLTALVLGLGIVFGAVAAVRGVFGRRVAG